MAKTRKRHEKPIVDRLIELLTVHGPIRCATLRRTLKISQDYLYAAVPRCRGRVERFCPPRVPGEAGLDPVVFRLVGEQRTECWDGKEAPRNRSSLAWEEPLHAMQKHVERCLKAGYYPQAPRGV